MCATDERSLKEAYQKQGYLILKGMLSSNEIAHLSALVEPIYQAWFEENEALIFKHKLLNMHSLTKPDYFTEKPENRLALFNAIAHPKLIQVAQSVFGDGLYFHNTQLFFNPTNCERLPYWHRDMQYSPFSDVELEAVLESMINLHFRIPLIKETGIELIPGTHKRWDKILEKQVRLERDGHHNNEPLEDAILLELEVGDVLIFNAQMLHRGNYDLNLERKALDVCIGKYHEFTAPALEEACLPPLEELGEIKHNTWYQRALEVVRKK